MMCLFTTALSAAPRFVSFDSGDVLLNGNDMQIYVDPADCKGVAIAARNLAEDFQRVSGRKPVVAADGNATILVGTIISGWWVPTPMMSQKQRTQTTGH